MKKRLLSSIILSISISAPLLIEGDVENNNRNLNYNLFNNFATIKESLYSKERKFINSGCTGPRGILLTTQDRKLSYIANDGSILWKSQKVYNNLSAGNAQGVDSVVQSSVYANGNFYVTYFTNFDSGYDYVKIDVYSEDDGQFLKTLERGKIDCKGCYGAYNLLNVKNSDEYIILANRGPLANDGRINIIETNSNKIIDRFESVSWTSRDMIYSVASQYVDNYIYVSYVSQAKLDHSQTYLKFVRYNIKTENVEELKKFQIELPFVDWPSVSSIPYNMYMDLKINNSGFNVFLTMPYGLGDEKAIYNYSFGSDSTELEINKVDFTQSGLDSTVSSMQIIGDYIYIWTEKSWYSDMPSIFRMSAKTKVTPKFKNKISNSKSEGESIKVLNIDNPLYSCIFETYTEDQIEIVDGLNGNLYFQNMITPQPSQNNNANNNTNNNAILYVSIAVGMLILISVIVIILFIKKRKKLKSKTIPKQIKCMSQSQNKLSNNNIANGYNNQYKNNNNFFYNNIGNSYPSKQWCSNKTHTNQRYCNQMGTNQRYSNQGYNVQNRNSKKNN